MSLTQNTYFKKLLFKISDDHFYNALKITLCTIISFALFYEKFGVSVAFGMTLGAALCSPIDTSSNLRNKVTSLITVAILLPAISVVLTLLYSYDLIFYIAFALIVFFSALISLYGQRASQLSFTLLLGLCLSFIHISESSTALSTGFHMFCGGILYLTISVLFYLVKPTKYINLQLATCIENVSKYLRLRSQYWEENPNIDEIKREQLTLQVQINDALNSINQYLDYNRMKIVNSNSNKKIIIATSILNDIMELAVSTTFNNKDIALSFDKEKPLKSSIKNITESFANNLEKLSQSMRLNTNYTPIESLTDHLQAIHDDIAKIHDHTTGNKLYIDDVLDYLNKQIKKIQSLECVCTGKIDTSNVTIKYQDIEKYFTPNNYRFKTLLENLNFQSTYLRYALRLTIAMVVGLAFGDFIALQKEYWVLLTIVVIMRPGYGLTRARMHKRVLGTIIGGLTGIVLLFFITNTVVLMILTAIAMLCGYWFSSNDYKIGVTFTTLYIILIYGLLKTGAEISVVYRITDTLMGALIALLAANYLWPSWEFTTIKKNLIDSLIKTITYINQFSAIYIEKKDASINVQKARQGAFIAIGNLMASYQRLIQEPKGKQKNRAELYKIAVLNQTIIGAVASLGSFFRSRPQDLDNYQTYGKYINTVMNNFNLSLNHLGEKNIPVQLTELLTATDIANMQIENNKKISLINPADTEQSRKLEETQLVTKQLSWIIDLSEQIESTSKAIK